MVDLPAIIVTGTITDHVIEDDTGLYFSMINKWVVLRCTFRSRSRSREYRREYRHRSPSPYRRRSPSPYKRERRSRS